MNTNPAESLIAMYAINDAMNQLILANLDPRAWRAKLTGAPAGGRGKQVGEPASGVRTIGSIYAHLHNCRLKWLRYNAPHLKRPAPLDPYRCTMKQTAAAHKKSAEQCLKMLREAFADDPNRPITKFQRDSWMPVWHVNGTMFAYMFSHEAHHRGQILMLAHQLGYRLPNLIMAGIWHWDKLWKKEGIQRPR
jgi:uncharacterized damage-inducible protein DinB